MDVLGFNSVTSSYFQVAGYPSCPDAHIRTLGVVHHLVAQIPATLQGWDEKVFLRNKSLTAQRKRHQNI